MYASQGPGGIFYSAVAAEPEMHPLIELGASLAPYVGVAAGANYLAKQKFPNSEYSQFDLFISGTRNLLNKFPMGFLNTFRLPELGSHYMSGAALGMELGQSVTGDGREVRQAFFGSEYFNKDTKNLLKETVGPENYSKISAQMGNENFQLVYEMEKDQVGRGSLYIMDMENKIVPVPSGGKKEVSVPKVGSAKLVSRDVGAMHLTASAELLDIHAGEDVRSITNPVFQGVAQNLEAGVENYNDLYRSSVTGQQAKLGLVPSVSGPMNSLGDFKRRSAYAGSYLSMGINRFNKLLKATYNQMPILGRTLEKVMERTGFSLKTKPDVFYKQYFKLGLQASKIGALALGINTLDHYREKFGILGNVVASAGVSGGLMYSYEKVAKKATEATRNRLGLISFGVQMLMPGFDKGIIEGVATTAKNVDIGRSYLGQVTLMSYYRRGLEGIAPGSTEFTTGLFLGLGAAALSYSGYGSNYLERKKKGSMHIGDKIFESIDGLLKNRFGFLSEGVGIDIKLPSKSNDLIKPILLDILYPSNKTVSENFKKFNPFSEAILKLEADDPILRKYRDQITNILKNEKGEITTLENITGKQIKKLKSFFADNEELIKSLYGDDLDIGWLKNEISKFTGVIQGLESSEKYKATQVNNEVNESLLRRISEINKRYGKDESLLSSIGKRLEIFGAEIYHSFYGATMTGEVSIELDGKMTQKEIGGELVNETYEAVAKRLNASPIVKRFGALTLGVTLLHQMASGAFFGMMEDPSDLKKMYSGKKLVEIKKGRWWEAGATPYEGGSTSYFRPHAYHSLMTKAKERSVWGDEVDEYSPLSRFFLKNFTYHLEEKNYYNRPYPLSGAAFEDVPILGKLLSATIGRVVKPTKLMHEEELYRKGPNGTEIAYLGSYGSSAELGEMGPGIPESPYSAIQTAGAIQYTFRELEGLTGYAKNVIQKIVSGREILGTRQYSMQTSNMMDSTVSNYWEKDLGGFAFLSEPIRRIFPRPRAEIESYNPIMNSMPSYIPEKLKRGDPYRLIDNGYARLPGKGYEALNPDVAGLDPEDYPDIHKYKILADIAPQSRLTMKLRENLIERKIGGVLTAHEESMLENVTEYHQKRLAANRDDIFHENAIKLPFISDVTSSLYLGTTETLRGGVAALENMIPGGFRPAAKLLGHTRSAIETYEFERVYNTANSFWDAPIRDWFRPALYSAAHFLGWNGKPLHVQKREELDAHFDKLQFLKFMQLADSAENQKDRKRYLGLAARTRTGVNPQGDALSMYLSLPTQEKKFFDAFAHAEGTDRERILELVPEDQKHLYLSVWNKVDSGEGFDLMSSSETVLDENYMYSQLEKVREGLSLGPTPPVDWIGWHKDVDINDIKIKYISSLGAEIHDYDAWESQVRSISRKPYLEGSELFMYNGTGTNRRSLRNKIIRSTNKEMYSGGFLFNSSQGYGEQSRAHLSYSDNRVGELSQLIQSNIRG